MRKLDGVGCGGLVGPFPARQPLSKTQGLRTCLPRVPASEETLGAGVPCSHLLAWSGCGLEAEAKSKRSQDVC